MKAALVTLAFLGLWLGLVNWAASELGDTISLSISRTADTIQEAHKQ